MKFSSAFKKGLLLGVATLACASFSAEVSYAQKKSSPCKGLAQVVGKLNSNANARKRQLNSAFNRQRSFDRVDTKSQNSFIDRMNSIESGLTQQEKSIDTVLGIHNAQSVKILMAPEVDFRVYKSIPNFNPKDVDYRGVEGGYVPEILRVSATKKAGAFEVSADGASFVGSSAVVVSMNTGLDNYIGAVIDLMDPTLPGAKESNQIRARMIKERAAKIKRVNSIAATVARIRKQVDSLLISKVKSETKENKRLGTMQAAVNKQLLALYGDVFGGAVSYKDALPAPTVVAEGLYGELNKQKAALAACQAR